jgi:hypothetical protein
VKEQSNNLKAKFLIATNITSFVQTRVALSIKVKAYI